MGCDWNRAFRNDFKEPDPLPKEDAARVSECALEPCEGYQTWKSVVLNGCVLGMVRVRIGGWSEYRASMTDEVLYGGDASKLNHKDNRYSLAVLALRELVGA